MSYTMKPSQKYAKALGRNIRISEKSALKICRVIRKKPLRRAKRLLNDLKAGRRTLGGKYYSKTVNEVLDLLNSCEKNADFAGLEKNKLLVHASAHKGTIMRRRRRKAAFGSRLKNTNLEIILIEKGSEEIKEKVEEAKRKQAEIDAAKKKPEAAKEKKPKEEKPKEEKPKAKEVEKQ